MPDPVREQLHMLVARIEHRETVLTRWGLRHGGGAGVTPPRSSPASPAPARPWPPKHSPGGSRWTSTSSACPTVVSKYIGETEKNLERIFAAAESLRCVLLFDEADSLFAKRSEIRGAGDSHANLQSGYLLQRLQSFEGLAILTTNLRSSIDAPSLAASTKSSRSKARAPTHAPNCGAPFWAPARPRSCASRSWPGPMPWSAAASARAWRVPSSLRQHMIASSLSPTSSMESKLSTAS